MPYYSSYTPSYQAGRPNRSPLKRRRSHRGRWLIFLIALVIIAGGSYLFFSKDASSTSTKSSKTTAAAVAKQQQAVADSNVTALGTQINGIITTNAPIDFSVSTIDLNTGLSEHYGDTASFDAASIGKLVTATLLLHDVEAGQTSLSQTMSDGNSAKYDLQQMIVISDDNTWATLNDYLTHPAMQAYAQSIGMTGYDADNNTMTSNDVATLLQKLYKNQLLNSTDTQLLLSYMKEANYRTYMLPAINSSYTVYHKVGLDEDNVHDVAIITKGNQAIILAIFTNGNGAYNWPQRAQMMQQIATDTLAAYFTAP